MRRIPLKTILIRPPGLPAEAEALPFSYGLNLVGVINAAASERGVALSEVNRLLRILAPLDQAMTSGAESFVLEDADYEHLKKTLDAFRGWRIVHAAIPAFVQDIADAECIAPSGVLSAES